MDSNHADTTDDSDDVQEQPGKSPFSYKSVYYCLCKGLHNCS